METMLNTIEEANEDSETKDAIVVDDEERENEVDFNFRCRS
jgi:3,4-dihydroxy-2-butanone 4-phosphate synthase